MTATSPARRSELLENLHVLLVGKDPLTLTPCPRGHRLYPNEIATGVCLRCAYEVAAKLRDRAAGARA